MVRLKKLPVKTGSSGVDVNTEQCPRMTDVDSSRSKSGRPSCGNPVRTRGSRKAPVVSLKRPSVRAVRRSSRKIGSNGRITRINSQLISDGIQLRTRRSVASPCRKEVKKSRCPQPFHLTLKGTTTKRRGRPLQSAPHVTSFVDKKHCKPPSHDIPNDVPDQTWKTQGVINTRKSGASRKRASATVPKNCGISGKQSKNTTKKSVRRATSTRKGDGSRKATSSSDRGEGIAPALVRAKEFPTKGKTCSASRERKLTEGIVTNQIKQDGPELKEAIRLEKRKQKLEEREGKKAERLPKNGMRPKLSQRKDVCEQERKRNLPRNLQDMDKRMKLDSHSENYGAKLAMLQEKFAAKLAKTFIPSPRNSLLPFVDVSIFWRIFVPGEVFFGRWLVLDEVPSHRYGVMAYLVVEQGDAAAQCVLYAQLTESPFAALPEEVYFVQIQSERNRSSMFQTIVEARFVDAAPQSPPFFYAIVLLRDSISLHDLWHAYPHPPQGTLETKAWSIGTVGRLAADILAIIELVYETGYTFRNVEMSHFHLDIRSRRLYLNNASEVAKSTELMDLKVKNEEVLFHNHWRGCPEFAPLSWHENGKNSVVNVTDCAEALFYIMMEMLGFMSWRGLGKDEIKLRKLTFDESILPLPLAEYWRVVRRAQEMPVAKVMLHDGYLLLNGKRGGATSSILDFRRLFVKLLSLYKIFGQVHDDDTPYDFDVVQSPTSASTKQARVIELLKKIRSVGDGIQTLKADIFALRLRREYSNRCAAQTRRERAAASARASIYKSELNASM
uniref:Protein kinase domain containing protein n=1 Tax=Haemonchus contortus TaxID=6289 RepID=A0A7I4XXQ6_HAECO